MTKLEKKDELIKLVEAGTICRSEANVRFIKWVKRFNQDHIFKAHLPYPCILRGCAIEALLIKGQVIYLNTINWG